MGLPQAGASCWLWAWGPASGPGRCGSRWPRNPGRA